MLTISTNPTEPSNALLEWNKHFQNQSASYISYENLKNNSSKKLNNLQASLGAKYPYELGLSELNEIPLPKPILTDLKENCNVYLQPRLSLFDLESCQFYGQTWSGNDHVLLNLREKKSSIGNLKLSKGTLVVDLSVKEPLEGNHSPNKLGGLSEKERLDVQFKNCVSCFKCI
jgi:hypothetical protein